MDMGELIGELNARGERVIFLGDGVPVYRAMIEEKMTAEYDFAPPHVNRQRAASVAATKRGKPSSRCRRATDAGSAALMLNWADMGPVPHMRETLFVRLPLSHNQGAVSPGIVRRRKGQGRSTDSARRARALRPRTQVRVKEAPNQGDRRFGAKGKDALSQGSSAPRKPSRFNAKGPAPAVAANGTLWHARRLIEAD